MINISVCIATYNGGKYIKEQLSSILEQLSGEDEVIISDDSSSDNTLTIIREFNDPRIKIFDCQKFRNPIFNFEHAIAQARGQYIFLSDQDDVWLPGKVIKNLSYLQEGYDVVLSDCLVVNEHLQTLSSSFFELNNSGRGLLRNIKKNSYLGCCLAIRNEFRQIILPFPAKIPMHDIWIGFAAELVGKVKFLNDRLIFYRRHGGNESPTGEKSPFTLWKKLSFRWNIIKYLPLIIRRSLRSSPKIN